MILGSGLCFWPSTPARWWSKWSPRDSFWTTTPTWETRGTGWTLSSYCQVTIFNTTVLLTPTRHISEYIRYWLRIYFEKFPNLLAASTRYLKSGFSLLCSFAPNKFFCLRRKDMPKVLKFSRIFVRVIHFITQLPVYSPPWSRPTVVLLVPVASVYLSPQWLPSAFITEKSFWTPEIYFY